RVLAFVRKHDNEILLVVANLSRFVQYVELDLSAYAGLQPVELFGRTQFPRIGELPYLLTLGGHAFYWFRLEPARTAELDAQAEAYEPPTIPVHGSWSELLRGEPKEQLEKTLASWLRGRHWYEGGDRQIRRVTLEESAFFPSGEGAICVLQVTYHEGQTERYVLPLGFAPEEIAGETPLRAPHGVLAHLRTSSASVRVAYDLLADPAPARHGRELLPGGVAHSGRTSVRRGPRPEEVGAPGRGIPRIPSDGHRPLSFGGRRCREVYRRL